MQNKSLKDTPDTQDQPKIVDRLPLTSSAIDGLKTPSDVYGLYGGKYIGTVVFTPLPHTEPQSYLVTTIEGIRINQMIQGAKFHPYQAGPISCFYVGDDFENNKNKRNAIKICATEKNGGIYTEIFNVTNLELIHFFKHC